MPQLHPPVNRSILHASNFSEQRNEGRAADRMIGATRIAGRMTSREGGFAVHYG
jgi:hypothetical protein